MGNIPNRKVDDFVGVLAEAHPLEFEGRSFTEVLDLADHEVGDVAVHDFQFDGQLIILAIINKAVENLPFKFLFFLFKFFLFLFKLSFLNFFRI